MPSKHQLRQLGLGLGLGLGIVLLLSVALLPIVSSWRQHAQRQKLAQALASRHPGPATQALRQAVIGASEARIYWKVTEADTRYPLDAEPLPQQPDVTVRGQPLKRFIETLHVETVKGESVWVTEVQGPAAGMEFEATAVDFYQGQRRLGSLRILSEGKFVRWYNPVQWHAESSLLPQSARYLHLLR